MFAMNLRPKNADMCIAPLSGTGAVCDTVSPLVTIAVPTFNRANLLEGCLRAVLAQTYPHFEVLVSDNASTDATPQLLRRIDDRRLRVIRQPSNIGLLPNWNVCLKEARGEYIVYVCDDDRITSEFLELCIQTMAGRSEIPIVVGLSDLHLTALGQTKPARGSHVLKTGIADGQAVLREFLADRITVGTGSVMMRTDLLRRRGGFPLDMPYAADVATWAPLLLHGDAGFVNRACATGTIHDKSETARLSVRVRLVDGRKAAAVIANSAGPLVESPAQRRKLQRESRGFFAKRNLGVLAEHRKNGGRLQEILHLLWQFRADMRFAGVGAATRLAAILLCPPQLADRLRRMRRTTIESEI
jgi:hypothetical protein